MYPTSNQTQFHFQFLDYWSLERDICFAICLFDMKRHWMYKVIWKRWRGWMWSNMIDNIDIYQIGQILGGPKAAFVAGVGGGLMLEWSATEYNYPPPAPPRVFILLLLLSHRSHWMEWLYKHYLTLSCSAAPSSSAHYSAGWDIPNIIWGCRLLYIRRVQQQEYYRMLGILTASWKTREEEQQ